tara:strand:+ start:95 stop:214 length:120 start_codon:yes stop_codon:yes gene_type:complete
MWQKLQEKLMLGKTVNRKEMMIWGCLIVGFSVLVDILIK